MCHRALIAVIRPNEDESPRKKREHAPFPGKTVLGSLHDPNPYCSNVSALGVLCFMSRREGTANRDMRLA